MDTPRQPHLPLLLPSGPRMAGLIRVHECVVADESSTVHACDCAPAFADSDADAPTKIDTMPVYRRVEICADARSDVHDFPPRSFSRNFSSICSFVVTSRRGERRLLP